MTAVRTPARPDDLIVLAIRVGVVLSLFVLAFTTDAGLADRSLVILLVSLAAAYALVLLSGRLLFRLSPPAGVVTATDGAFALSACALTGGVHSLAVAVLPLVVIAASLRGQSRQGVGIAFVVGAGFGLLALIPDPVSPLSDRVWIGVWWLVYLPATASLAGVFVRRLRRGYEEAAEARAEAIADHAALVEERDLRARLLDSQQARLDGLRVIMHEFRTPVTSMSALARAAAGGQQASPAATLNLLTAHARHLEDMLDGLADVALADGSPVGRGRERRVPLAQLCETVFDGAGVDPDRRVSSIRPADLEIVCDPQRLRRILVNLVENAARVSGSLPVELGVVRTRNDLVIEVRDRGPGVPDDQLGLVTRKYTSFGERRGTSGLGLWIVEQLTTSMNGTLTLLRRDDGGLVARLVLPRERT